MGADLYGVNGRYFRDSYNSSDLLWKFGLSWWDDVIPMVKDGRLAPDGARCLIDWMGEREGQFEREVGQLAKREQRYFRDKYLSFRDFLNETIGADAPVECSL